jgi:hypothetical protein
MPKTACPHCHKTFNVTDALLGKRAKCAACGKSFEIKATGDAPSRKITEKQAPIAPAFAPFDDDEYQVERPIRPFADTGVNGAASEPGNVRLSRQKLLEFYPDFFSPTAVFKRVAVFLFDNNVLGPRGIATHLLRGDSRAAVVMSTQPLLIAAFSDEFDAVVMLRFDEALRSRYSLQVGDRLLTINTYTRVGKKPARDIILGPRTTGTFRNFTPLIAEFLSDDLGRIQYRKASIENEEWRRTQQFGEAFLQRWPGKARDGRVLKSHAPCIS